jgi:CHAT domain-containing protein
MKESITPGSSLKLVAAMVLMLASLVSYGQIPRNKNKVDSKGLRQGKWTISFDKNWQETKIKDSISFYRIIAYKDDKPIGITTDYFISGKKQFEGKLISDRPEIIDGEATWYYESGQPSKVSHYADSVSEGQQVMFYENGNKYAEGEYRNGRVEGRVTYFGEDGLITNVEYYQQGEKVSLQGLWDKAISHFNTGDYKNAEPLLTDLNIAFRHALGDDDGNLAHLLNALGRSQIGVGKVEEGVNSVKEMMRVRELQRIERDSVYRDWLYEFVLQLRALGKTNYMEELLKTALRVQLQINPKITDHYLAYSRTLASLYVHEKRYDEAEKIYSRNLEQLKQIYPADPGQYAHEMAGMGIIYEALQQYSRAEKLYTDAIAIYRASKDTSENYSTALSSLVGYLIRQGNSIQAIPYAKEDLQLQAVRKGRHSSEYAKALFSLNECYRFTYKLKECASVLSELETLYKDLYGEKSDSYSNLMYQFGLYHAAIGNYENAELDLQKALDILKSLSKPANSEFTVLRIMSSLAEVYVADNQTVKAEVILAESFEKIKSIRDRNNFAIAETYQKIGGAQASMENYEEAEACYKEALDIIRIINGPDHHNYFQMMSWLTKVYNQTGRAIISIDTLDRLINKLVREGKKNSPSYITLLSSKSSSYRQLGLDSMVIAIEKEVAATLLNNYGDTYPDYISSLSSLAMRQISVSPKEAEENIQLLETLLKKAGVKQTDDNYDTFLTLKWSMANKQNDLLKAIAIAREKVTIAKLKGKPKNGLIDLGLSLFAANQQKEALSVFQDYIDIVMDDLDKVFPYLSENQKVGFYNSEIKYYLDLYYFMALAEPLNMRMGLDSAQKKAANEESRKIRYINHPNVANIFNYQLQTKGILFEANQKMKKAILNSKNDKLITLFNTWQATIAELNRIFLEPESKQKEEKKLKLSAEVKSLEKQLALQSSYFNQPKASQLTWRDVQKKLKDGEALVEILAISAGLKLHPGEEKYSDFYLAFVVTPQTKDYPLCVRIAKGDSLENRYLKNYQNSIRFKMDDRFSYDKFWKILADTLKDFKKIYFSPDGVYHKVNINTLRNPETGKFVLEEKEIQFISQARDFVFYGQRAPRPPSSIVLIGAPNYNGSPQNKIKENLTLPGTVKLKKDSTQRFFSGESISELPGTHTEVTNIKAIANNHQLPVREFLYDAATEEVLKALQSPSILHIATHGFFLTEANIAASASDSKGRTGFANFTSEDLKNPLRRSGLLMAYCRHAFNQEKEKLRLSEDGILTADEAQNLNLDDTDMVVLSACETGLGEVRNGEGVYGLQRAFQTAGAKSVLMSLWTVSDQATQELMTEFYNQWFALKDKHTAFRQAQLNLKAKYNHPYYWGAFAMMGE